MEVDASLDEGADLSKFPRGAEIRRIIEDEIPPHKWVHIPNEWISFGFGSTKF